MVDKRAELTQFDDLSSLQLQVWLLTSMVVDSLAVAGQTLVAVYLGEGCPDRARVVANRLLQLGIMLGLTVAAVLGATAPEWPFIFTKDRPILDSIEQIVPLTVSLLPVNSLVYVLDGILIGAGDFQYLTFAMVGAAAIAIGALLQVDSLGWGLPGIWAALSLLMVGRLATLTWRYQLRSGPLPPLRFLYTPEPESQNGNSVPAVHHASYERWSHSMSMHPYASLDSVDEADAADADTVAGLEEADGSAVKHQKWRWSGQLVKVHNGYVVRDKDANAAWQEDNQIEPNRPN